MRHILLSVAMLSVLLAGCDGGGDEEASSLAPEDAFVELSGYRYISTPQEAEAEMRRSLESSEGFSEASTGYDSRIVVNEAGKPTAAVVSIGVDPALADTEGFRKGLLAGLAQDSPYAVGETELDGVTVFETLTGDGETIITFQVRELVVILVGEDEQALEDIAESIAKRVPSESVV